MAAKILSQENSPATQTVEVVRALITYQQKKAPAKMPEFYRLSGSIVLVKNNKGDAYYTTLPDDCSCPAKSFNTRKLCKHSRKYFPQKKKSQKELYAEGDAELAKAGPKILARPPQDSIRPVEGWIGPDGKKANGPIDSLPAFTRDAFRCSDKAILPMHTK